MRDSILYFKRLKEFYGQYMESFLEKDSFFREKALQLREAIFKTKKAYIEHGSFEFCRVCAQKGVRCCGEGLEWKLRPEEFFINLYLLRLEERDLKLEDRRAQDCLFLGEFGCILILTPLFCRNFFCKELSEFLGHKGLVYLQNVIQDEAELTFKLCEYLKKKFPRILTL